MAGEIFRIGGWNWGNHYWVRAVKVTQHQLQLGSHQVQCPQIVAGNWDSEFAKFKQRSGVLNLKSNLRVEEDGTQVPGTPQGKWELEELISVDWEKCRGVWESQEKVW